MEQIEILTLIIAPIGISVFTSIVAFLIQRQINRKGKLRVYYKLISPNLSKFQIGCDVGGGKQIHVPLLLEIYNPSSTTKVIRDLSAFVSYRGKEVFKLNKALMIEQMDPTAGKTSQSIGGEYGSSSFAIASNDIVLEWFLFVALIKNDDVDISFDEIKVSLYDFKNKRRTPTVYKAQKSRRLGNPTQFEDQNGDWQMFKI